MVLPPIVFESDELIAFDKPSGLLVAPDRWDKEKPNLMTIVHKLLGSNVANVHRLDADTSGVLLCTKTKAALDFMSGQFQSKTAGKKYVALTVGTPESEEYVVDLPIGDDPKHLGRMRVQKRTGKPSVTDFKVAEKFGRWAFVECRPVTGRTHQIRVHLQATKTPILNDPFYGDGSQLLLSDMKRAYKGRATENPLISRMALHASELTVKLPGTGEAITIAAPLPREFEVALKYLRKFALATRMPPLTKRGGERTDF